jgi:hypothetical protein
MRLPAAVIFFLGIVAAAPAGGQSFVGGVRGSVQGPAGPVAAVAIQITNEDTGLTRSGVGNDRGEYAFTSLLPGTYVLTASADGYKTFRRSGLRVGTQSFLTIDVVLEIGSIAETVVVRGEATALERSSASVGTLLTREAVDALPSAGRNIFYTAGRGATTPTWWMACRLSTS